MTTPEERLRELLQAEDLAPAGDGLRRIEARLAARRSRLVPVAAIAGAVVVAAAAAITVSVTDGGALRQARQVPKVASPQPTGCAGGLCPEPRPSPTTSTNGVTTSANGTPVWPFTSDAQAADWEAQPGSRGWAADPVKVTQHLMDDYLKLPGAATSRLNDDGDLAIVEVSAGGRPVSQVRLERVGRDTSGPWSVTSAASDDLVVRQPGDGDEVTSPLQVTGTVSGVDQSVHLRLMAAALLGEAYAPAGNEQPWTQALAWTRSDWSVAALTGTTFNGKGDLSAVTVTAVRRAGSRTAGLAPAGSAFVAIDNEHVVLVDALTGQRQRQLSYPAAGVIDSGPDRGGDDGVVWVRTGVGGCSSSILRIGLAYGASGFTVDTEAVVRERPSLSEGGRSLGWLERPCGGGNTTVLVRGPDARFSTIAVSTEPVTDLDVRDDGYAVAQVGRRVRVLAPGVTDVTAGRAVTVDPGCTASAPAWDGNNVVGWEGCPSGWVLDHWTADGARVSRSAVVPGMSRPLHTAVAAGQLLVALEDHRITRVSVARRVDVPNALRWGQPDW